MKTFDDVKVHIDVVGGAGYDLISLNKLINEVGIKDILGTINDDDYCFDAWTIILNDGQQLDLQGEHDMVYVHDYYGSKVFDRDELENVYKTDPDYLKFIGDDK